MYNCCIIGSSLPRCTFNGQQCCSALAVNFFISNLGRTINDGAFNIGTVFAGAHNAIDQLRNKTEGMYVYTCSHHNYILYLSQFYDFGSLAFVWILSDV